MSSPDPLYDPSEDTRSDEEKEVANEKAEEYVDDVTCKICGHTDGWHTCLGCEKDMQICGKEDEDAHYCQDCWMKREGIGESRYHDPECPYCTVMHRCNS